MRKSLILLVILLLTLSGCAAKDTACTDISCYGKWSGPAGDILEESFVLPLPSAESVSKYGQDYYCRESGSAFGDKSIIVDLTLAYPTETEFAGALEGLSSSFPQPVEIGHRLVYPVIFSGDSAADYLDGEIYDGMFYAFELLYASPEDCTLRILKAHVWDYFEDAHLSQALRELTEAK